MKKSRRSLSKAKSIEEIGEFWDTHDLAQNWDETRPTEFEVDLQSELRYYAIDRNAIQNCMWERGI